MWDEVLAVRERLWACFVVFTVDFAIGEALIKNFAGCRGQSDAGCIASAVQPADQRHINTTESARNAIMKSGPKNVRTSPAKSPIVHHGELQLRALWHQGTFSYSLRFPATFSDARVPVLLCRMGLLPSARSHSGSCRQLS